MWISNGLSSATGFYMAGAGNTASYSASVYTTAFSLTAGSTLLGTLGTSDGWQVGDTIVGLGGVFAATGNSSLTYSGANGTVNLHLVVKYGAPGATWSASSGTGSLTAGGEGAVLLGVTPETIGPTTGLVPTADAPTYLAAGNAQDTLPGGAIEGQVLTLWSGNAIVGFEDFMDLNVLDSQESANSLGVPAIQLGDEVMLDLQQGQNAVQDSLYTLPLTLQPVPEPSALSLLATAVALLGGTRGLQMVRRHLASR